VPHIDVTVTATATAIANATVVVFIFIFIVPGLSVRWCRTCSKSDLQLNNNWTADMNTWSTYASRHLEILLLLHRCKLVPHILAVLASHTIWRVIVT